MATGDPFKHVIPGQPAAFQAAWVNAVSDHLRHGGGPTMPLDNSRVPPGILWAYNGTGADVARFTAVGFSGPVMPPTGDPGSESENGFASRLAVTGQALGVDDYTARFAVFLEPCPNGSVAPAVAWGIAPALVNITTEGDKFCDADQTTGKLLSDPSKGSAEIIWSETSTGTDVRCLIRIGGKAVSVIPDPDHKGDMLIGQLSDETPPKPPSWILLHPPHAKAILVFDPATNYPSWLEEASGSPCVLVCDSDGVRWQAITSDYYVIQRIGTKIVADELHAV